MLSHSLLWMTILGAENPVAIYNLIDDLVATHRLRDLKRLLQRCRVLRFCGLTEWKATAIYDRSINSLALTEGIDFAAMSIEIAKSSGAMKKSKSMELPHVISKVVASQPQTVLEEILNQEQNTEVVALVLQESVVRGKLSSKSHSAKIALEKLVRENHPLSVLPLDLLSCESELELRSYSPNGSSHSTPDFFEDSTTRKIKTSSYELRASEKTSTERSKQILRAVLNWQTDSNGNIESRTFVVESFDSTASLGLYLPNLGLDCTSSTDDLSLLQQSSLTHVYSILFSAAANGGAYSRGEDGAYGRLATWESIAGLFGAAEQTPIQEIFQKAEECQWIVFKSNSGWFCGIAWDLGIACFNPATKELSILAATDMD